MRGEALRSGVPGWLPWVASVAASVNYHCATNAIRLLGMTHPGKGRIGRSGDMVTAVRQIRRRAAQTFTGAFRTTAGAAAEVEAHMLSV